MTENDAVGSVIDIAIDPLPSNMAMSLQQLFMEYRPL